MTAEKQKRLYYSGPAAYGKRLSRRTIRKVIRLERKRTRRMGLRKTRFVCPFCGAALKLHDWLWERGGVIRCPGCLKAVMDLHCTKRVKM
jgi:hypothetical protein